MKRRAFVALLVVLAQFAAGAGRAVPAGAARAGSGYWMLTRAGQVFGFGGAADLGQPSVPYSNHVDIEPTPEGHGYWILTAEGFVSAFGDARYLGGGVSVPAGERYVSMSATPEGTGYWLFTNRGRVVSRGAAQHFGDMAGVALNGPVLASVATPSGHGYAMVGSDGGIFTFGDSKFHGSMGGKPLNRPVMSMAWDPDGSGYWLVASDGGIFAFDAPFYGSMGGTRLNKPISGIVGGSAGYLMVAEDGGIFAFGDNQFFGSLGANPPASPVVAVAVIRGEPSPGPGFKPAISPDETPPDTVIDSGPPETVRTSTASFSFSSTEAGKGFRCRLDGGALSSCTSPKQYSGLAEGNHAFEVVSIDPAGNTDPSPARRSFTVDTTAPRTTLDSGPSGAVSTPDVDFSFSSNEAGSSFTCRLDQGPVAECTSPRSYAGLADGAHTFEVRAVDPAGNTDATPARQSFTVDATAPDTVIVSGPAETIRVRSATFTFSSDAGATFTCRLDGGQATDCTSPESYSGLADGIHTFEVTATDSAGNADPTPATRSFRVDTTPDTTAPDTLVDSGPSGIVSSSSARFSFSSTEEGSTFECSLDGDPYVVCVSPQSYSGLAEGSHTFRVRATDAAGNTDPTPASRPWTLDSTPELFSDGFESGNLFRWTLGVGGDGTAVVQGSVVKRGRYAARLTASPTPGSYARARWTAPAPETDVSAAGDFQITAEGPLGSNVPIFRLFDPSGAALVSLYRQNQSLDRIWVQHSGSVYELTSGTLPLDTWGRFEVHTVTAGEGASTLEVRQNGAPIFRTTTASLGTAGVATVQIGYEVSGQGLGVVADDISVIRGTALDTMIDSGPTGSLRTDSATFTFSSTDAGANFECRLDDGLFFACTSPALYAGLTEGNHTFAVRAVDSGGDPDPTPATQSFSVDQTPPQTAINSGPSGTVGTASVSLSFSSSEGGSTFECRMDAAPFVTCSSPASHSGLAEGSHTFEVRAIDAAGNIDPTPDVRSFEVDSPALFSDGFEHGVFTGWTSVRRGGEGTAVVQSDVARRGAFAARLSSTATAGSYASARWTAPAPQTDLSAAGDFQVVTEGGTGSNVPILRLFDPAGVALVSLYRQNLDFDHVWVQHSGSAYNMTSGTLPMSTWGRFDVHVVASGAGASTLEVRQNGVLTFRTTTASLGTAGVASVQIGYEVAGQTVGILADDVSVIRGTEPDTAIESGPSGTVGESGATFTFSSPDATSTFQCRLDGGDFAPCSSPASYSDLAEGAHGFEVMATNAAGNSDPTPAMRRWTYRVGGPPDKLLIADHRNKRLLITDMNGGLVWKWDNPTGRTDGSSGPLGVRWMPGNRILATFGTGEVGLVDVATKTFVWKTSGWNEDWFRSPYDAEILPDGHLAVAMRFNSGGRVDVYNLQTGELVWRHLLSNVHSVTYRSADQSYNSPYPTLIIGGWGVTKEVAYAPSSDETGQTVAWNTPTEFTHDVVVVEDDNLLTTEGYYIQKINRQGTRLWSVYTGEGQECRRVAVLPDGNLVYTGAEASRIEFRRATNGSLMRSWSVLSDGTGVNYPYGIQVVDYQT